MLKSAIVFESISLCKIQKLIFSLKCSHSFSRKNEMYCRRIITRFVYTVVVSVLQQILELLPLFGRWKYHNISNRGFHTFHKPVWIVVSVQWVNATADACSLVANSFGGILIFHGSHHTSAGTWSCINTIFRFISSKFMYLFYIWIIIIINEFSLRK